MGGSSSRWTCDVDAEARGRGEALPPLVTPPLELRRLPGEEGEPWLVIPPLEPWLLRERRRDRLARRRPNHVRPSRIRSPPG